MDEDVPLHTCSEHGGPCRSASLPCQRPQQQQDGMLLTTTRGDVRWGHCRPRSVPIFLDVGREPYMGQRYLTSSRSQLTKKHKQKLRCVIKTTRSRCSLYSTTFLKTISQPSQDVYYQSPARFSCVDQQSVTQDGAGAGR